MKKKLQRTRKNIMVNLALVKRAKKILGASNDNEDIEMLLKSVADRKTNEEVWEATKKFIQNAHDPNFKPLFS